MGSCFFQPFSSNFTLSLCFSRAGSRPVPVHWVSSSETSHMEQSKQMLRGKLEARKEFLSSHFSHVEDERNFPAPDAWIILLFNAWKLCSPPPCWLTELTLPASPSRMTARKLLQCNLKTVKYRMSRWQVTSPSHEQPMSLWHRFSPCWAALTEPKQEASPVEMMSVKATSQQHRPYDCGKEFGHWQEALVTKSFKYLLLR